MDIFKRFANWLSGGDTTKNPNEKIDAERVRTKLKVILLKEVDALYYANSNITLNKHILIWMDTDSLTFGSFEGFENELLAFFSEERGYSFGKIEFKIGKPEKVDECRTAKFIVGSNEIDLFLAEKIENKSNDSIVQKAKISILEGKGNLFNETYELSSEELTKGNKKFYNIGRGQNPTMESGNYRHNHIAIDDSINHEINGCVSRAHARIGFSETIGFYIQVEYGGSRISGNRTRIIRNDEKIEVENTNVKEPLLDGDLIELGKAVVLKYNVEP